MRPVYSLSSLGIMTVICVFIFLAGSLPGLGDGGLGGETDGRT
jgi:hypothetical protein